MQLALFLRELLVFNTLSRIESIIIMVRLDQLT